MVSKNSMHLKTKEGDLSLEQIKQEKPNDSLSSCWKSIWQNSISIHNQKNLIKGHAENWQFSSDFMVRYWMWFLWMGQGQGWLLSPVLSHHTAVLAGSPSRRDKIRKRNKEHAAVRKEEIKLSIFAVRMIIYNDNSKESLKKKKTTLEKGVPWWLSG